TLWGLLAFVALAGCWGLVWALGAWSDPLPRSFPTLSRLSGYLAAVCLCIPYLHCLRRLSRAHRGWPAWFWGMSMSTWLRGHILCAYLGFAFLLLHCWARAGTPLTFWLLGSVWLVMVSGVVGYYGQRFLYRILPAVVPSEKGLERLEAERAELSRQADQE